MGDPPGGRSKIGVANRTRGAGGGGLQANELAAAIQAEVAPGENGRMTLRAGRDILYALT